MQEKDVDTGLFKALRVPRTKGGNLIMYVCGEMSKRLSFLQCSPQFVLLSRTEKGNKSKLMNA